MTAPRTGGTVISKTSSETDEGWFPAISVRDPCLDVQENGGFLQHHFECSDFAIEETGQVLEQPSHIYEKRNDVAIMRPIEPPGSVAKGCR